MVPTALRATCPAAKRVDPPTGPPLVICGVIENANLVALGDGKSKRRGNVDPTFAGDSRQVDLFCAGSGLPGSVCSYTGCDIWIGEQRRLEEAKRLQKDTPIVEGGHHVRRDRIVEL